MFDIGHDIFHLLPFVDEISLTEPLEAPLDVFDWFQYTQTREAALLMIVAEADGFAFDNPCCKQDSTICHRVAISSDIDGNDLGCLFRVDQEDYDCDCPRVMFRPDQDCRRCIRRALLYLDDRFDRFGHVQEHVLDDEEGKSADSTTTVSQPKPSTSKLSNSKSSTSKPLTNKPTFPKASASSDIQSPAASMSNKRARDDSDDEQPKPKKARYSSRVRMTANEVIDLTQDSD
ncbi:hypothetical protein K435DRAFT_799625 [Dendrothele bispora CBS 962.96]|uniref:Uncharacterized protein n=1 Tax=Dendrothele bispora (strain CBS 962.96) TaxID=1314807 RepID=A0A4S8LVB6_DENBC|nr:hypothetical protein K435DRAFT_799625 [Dendrothele bispora CBS 962.96]